MLCDEDEVPGSLQPAARGVKLKEGEKVDISSRGQGFTTAQRHWNVFRSFCRWEKC